MPQFDDNHVKLNGGVVVWDGVTQPETQQQGSNAGKPKWTLKVLFPSSCPDLALFDQLAQKKLLESKFKGQLPAGGRMPIAPVQPGEYNDMFPGWYCISFKTTLRAPDVYDENGQPLDPMQYGPLIYQNQQVDVLAHCYDYDNAGNKGISAGLDALAVVTSANRAPMNFGGGVNTASAFGGGQQPQQQPQGGFGQQQQQPQGGFGQQQQQPQGGFGQQQQQPQGGFGQQQQQPQNGFGQQPQQQPQGGFGQQPQQQPQGGFGQQSTNYLPGQ